MLLMRSYRICPSALSLYTMILPAGLCCTDSSVANAWLCGTAVAPALNPGLLFKLAIEEFAFKLPYVLLCFEVLVLPDLSVSLLARERNIVSRDQPWKMGRRTGRQALIMAREHSMSTQYAVGAT